MGSTTGTGGATLALEAGESRQPIRAVFARLPRDCNIGAVIFLGDAVAPGELDAHLAARTGSWVRVAVRSRDGSFVGRHDPAMWDSCFRGDVRAAKPGPGRHAIEIERIELGRAAGTVDLAHAGRRLTGRFTAAVIS